MHQSIQWVEVMKEEITTIMWRDDAGLTVVTTSVTFISAYLHLKGHCEHSTLSEFSGGSNIVPHWGQKGHVVDDMTKLLSMSPKLWTRRMLGSVMVPVQYQRFKYLSTWLSARRRNDKKLKVWGKKEGGRSKERGYPHWQSNDEQLQLITRRSWRFVVAAVIRWLIDRLIDCR